MNFSSIWYKNVGKTYVCFVTHRQMLIVRPRLHSCSVVKSIYRILRNLWDAAHYTHPHHYLHHHWPLVVSSLHPSNLSLSASSTTLQTLCHPANPPDTSIPSKQCITWNSCFNVRWIIQHNELLIQRNIHFLSMFLTVVIVIIITVISTQ